jgi:hypothetical protein
MTTSSGPSAFSSTQVECSAASQASGPLSPALFEQLNLLEVLHSWPKKP